MFIFCNKTPVNFDLTIKEFILGCMYVVSILSVAYILANMIYLSKTRIWLYTHNPDASSVGLCYAKEAEQDDWLSPWEKLTINWYITKDEFLRK